jgi:hypothetical protein
MKPLTGLITGSMDGIGHHPNARSPCVQRYGIDKICRRGYFGSSRNGVTERDIGPTVMPLR